ncbi:winged helix-turn-helix domain-containing protein [uncultured Rhodospira sp.]|uniref:helix-turn-helix domain-containing protein n=1 Tax=uncultured Rhodospira sp. TaxID=1936189 RepID=UPI003459CA11
MDGVRTWTRESQVRWMERRLGKTMSLQNMSKVLKRQGLSRQKARPSHPRRVGVAGARKRKMVEVRGVASNRCQHLGLAGGKVRTKMVEPRGIEPLTSTMPL